MLIGMFVRGTETYFRNILISGNEEQKIVKLFEIQRNEFFSSDGEQLPEVEFTPSRPTEDEAVAYVNHPEVAEFFFKTEAKNEPQDWELESDLPCIKAVFMRSEKTNEVLVQLLERRRVLLPSSGWLFRLGDGNTLVEDPQYALHFDKKLVAVLRREDDKLLFKSFSLASRIFDLSDYMLEATEETARQFLSLPNIGVPSDDVDAALSSLTKLQLKKIPRILAMGYVNKFTAEELATRAKAMKCNVDLKVSNGKIMLPQTSRDIDVFLLFLADRLMSSYLDDEHDYETSSSRRIDG